MKRTTSVNFINSANKSTLSKRERQKRFQRVKNENEYEYWNTIINKHVSLLGGTTKVFTRDGGSYNLFTPGINIIPSLQEINKIVYKEKECFITLYKLEFMESRLFPLILLNGRLENNSQKETSRICVELLTRMTKIYPMSKNLNDLPFLKMNSAYKDLFILNISIIHAPGSGNLTINEKLKAHFDLIVQFCNENLFEIIMIMASDKNEAIWHTLILEIFYHILEYNSSDDLFIDPKMEASSKGVKLMEQMKNRQDKIRKKFSKVCPKVWVDTKKGYEKPVDIRQTWQEIPKFDSIELREKTVNGQRILTEHVNKKRRVVLDDQTRKCIKLASLKIITSNAFEVLIITIQKEIEANLDNPDINKIIAYYLYLVDYILNFRIRITSENSLFLKDGVLSNISKISDISQVLPAITVESFEWTFSLLFKCEPKENSNRILQYAFKCLKKTLDHYEGMTQLSDGPQKKFISDEIIKNYWMFYKITIMFLFSRILDDIGHRQEVTLGQDELLSFILNISNKLLSELPKNSLLYVELLYPKNSEDCKISQQGYNRNCKI
ncbi:unnamed protein product [Rhizophagus irregularis]|nr:unnamed protein product [Rhizophagus irregularis]